MLKLAHSRNMQPSKKPGYRVHSVFFIQVTSWEDLTVEKFALFYLMHPKIGKRLSWFVFSTHYNSFFLYYRPCCAGHRVKGAATEPWTTWGPEKERNQLGNTRHGTVLNRLRLQSFCLWKDVLLGILTIACNLCSQMLVQHSTFCSVKADPQEQLWYRQNTSHLS